MEKRKFQEKRRLFLKYGKGKGHDILLVSRKNENKFE